MEMVRPTEVVVGPWHVPWGPHGDIARGLSGEKPRFHRDLRSIL